MSISLVFQPNTSVDLNLVFGEPPPPAPAGLRYFNGSVFLPGVLKRWNSLTSTWETKPLKRWNGASWDIYNT